MTFQCRERTLTLRRGDPALMGILNVTPDSFSDGGRHQRPDRAIAHALAMLAEGAALIDIGGESTRPGHTPVPAQEELARVVPIVSELRKLTELPISVDTMKAVVAEAALEAGADLVNDVSALGDPDMPKVLRRFGAGCVLMHSAPLPPGQAAPAMVAAWLKRRFSEAQELCGLGPEHFIIDPGVGFGKDVNQNLALIAHLEQLAEIPAPVLLAMSRKSCIGAVANEPDPARRLPGTLACAILARNGCHMLRIHDVGATRQALAVARAMDEV